MKSLIALVVTAIVLALSATALADPSSPENGCHGYYTTQYKESVGDRGGQGSSNRWERQLRWRSDKRSGSLDRWTRGNAAARSSPPAAESGPQAP